MQEDVDKRRDIPRLRQGLTVVARYGAERQVCIVENSSPRGAGLRVNPHLELPDHFELLLANEEALPAKVIWRRGEQMGVRFPTNFKLSQGSRHMLEGFKRADLDLS